ncbi:hypothetical protein ACFPRL_28650 [Pseudoclavibacter helvolus]
MPSMPASASTSAGSSAVTVAPGGPALATASGLYSAGPESPVPKPVASLVFVTVIVSAAPTPFTVSSM